MATDTSDGVAITVVAIREKLMEYFKGSCVKSVTKDSNVRLMELNIGARGLSRAERWRLGYKRPMLLFIDNVPLATLGQEPDIITFHSSVMGRSKQLKDVHTHLKEFLTTYLPGVTVDEREGSVFYG